MHVKKVVDLVARIPKHLDLHFCDFCMNLYRIYKFAGLENKKKKKELFAQRPLEDFFFSRIGPWPEFEAGERRAAGFRRLGSTAARGARGRSKRRARATLGWPRLSLGRPVAAPPRNRGGSGGSWRRRRRSGGPGRRRAGRGAPVEAKEASCGGCGARGRAAEGAPRQARGRRR